MAGYAGMVSKVDQEKGSGARAQVYPRRQGLRIVDFVRECMNEFSDVSEWTLVDCVLKCVC
jgi:hypothetical protein